MAGGACGVGEGKELGSCAPSSSAGGLRWKLRVPSLQVHLCPQGKVKSSHTETLLFAALLRTLPFPPRKAAAAAGQLERLLCIAPTRGALGRADLAPPDQPWRIRSSHHPGAGFPKFKSLPSQHILLSL